MRDQEDQVKELTEFPEKREYDPAYKLLQQENDRLQHLTTVLIDHIWKSGERGLPLKEIDKQMKIFDDGGMDGIQRNK